MRDMRILIKGAILPIKRRRAKEEEEEEKKKRRNKIRLSRGREESERPNS